MKSATTIVVTINHADDLQRRPHTESIDGVVMSHQMRQMRLPTLVEKKFPRSLLNLLEIEIVFNEEQKK